MDRAMIGAIGGAATRKRKAPAAGDTDADSDSPIDYHQPPSKRPHNSSGHTSSSTPANPSTSCSSSSSSSNNTIQLPTNSSNSQPLPPSQSSISSSSCSSFHSISSSSQSSQTISSQSSSSGSLSQPAPAPAPATTTHTSPASIDLSTSAAASSSSSSHHHQPIPAAAEPNIKYYYCAPGPVELLSDSQLSSASSYASKSAARRSQQQQRKAAAEPPVAGQPPLSGRERDRESVRICDRQQHAELHSDAESEPDALVLDQSSCSASPASPYPALASVASSSSASSQPQQQIRPSAVIERHIGVGTTKPADLRACPLPRLVWADAPTVWRLMCRKDERDLLRRNPLALERHPGIQPRMRAILLDWLMEVCEVYKLHRESYYLAVDYLDRYLAANMHLAKTRLQLIGITCLFTAAKVEEIYPPKIAEFAYVTDGACSEEDIVRQELLLMVALNWRINPVTVIGWLSVYMQLNSSNRVPRVAEVGVARGGGGAGAEERKQARRNASLAFVYPQFSALEFVLAARILDLCTLDVEMAHFQYSVLAAAVLALTINRRTALRVSGLDWELLQPCVEWMEPFYDVVMAESSTQLFLGEQEEQLKQSYGLSHLGAEITTDDTHIIQTHTTSMQLFELTLKTREDRIQERIRAKRLKRKSADAAAAKLQLQKQQQLQQQQQNESTGTTTTSSSSAAAADPHDAAMLMMSPNGPLTPPDSNRKFSDGRQLLQPTSQQQQQSSSSSSSSSSTKATAFVTTTASDAGVSVSASASASSSSASSVSSVSSAGPSNAIHSSVSTVC